MKTIKIFALLFLISLSTAVKAQEVPADMMKAIQSDDSLKLSTMLTKANVNTCYGNYSVLSHAIRYGATKCFNLAITDGADVNLSCSAYVSPLMFAAKYGRLDMCKILVAKGANVSYTYHGDYKAADGENPITYATKYQHQDIADWLATQLK